MRLQQILRLAKSSFAAWLALGALFIGFLFANTPGINGVLGTFIDLSRSESFCRTLGILYLACLIGGVLQKLDLDSLICSRLSSNIGKPAAMVVVPFLLGLFPTVGGAKLSLVFVENLGKETKAQKQDLALINFWFRHTCNFANPLIPGTVLASAISGADLGSIIEITFPLMIISTVYGWKKFVRKLVKIVLNAAYRIAFRVKISGKLPEEGAYILCCNHINYLDAAAIVLFNKRK